MTRDTLSEQTARKYDTYGSTVFRLCYIMMCNKKDAEDATQDTFVRYMNKQPAFENSSHERAWFLRVAANICRDHRRISFRHKEVALEETITSKEESDDTEILWEVLSLPDKYKIPIYLHYVEGYSIQDITEILNCNESTVKTWLFRGREKLKLEL
jgi:RNA polymerase sigma factor (sigma-70 family)